MLRMKCNLLFLWHKHFHMQPFHIKELPAKTLITGFEARFIHTGSLTFSFVDIEAGHTLPVHSHPHEQVMNVLEGRLTFHLNGEDYLMEGGMTVVIPSNVPHGATALTNCRVLDVFNPERDDYKV